MENLFNTVLTTSLYASIVGLFLLAFKALAKNKISPKWHFLLWLLLLVKLLVPFGPESPFSLFNRMPDQLSTLDAGTLTTVIGGIVPIAPQPVLPNDLNADANEKIKSAPSFISTNVPALQPSSIDVEFVLSVLWLTGAGFILLWFFWMNLSILLRLHKHKPSEDERIHLLISKSKVKLGVTRNIPVIFQNMIQTPCMYGIFKPRILLTEELSQLGDNELSYIFMHELAHYKRKDIAINYMMILLQAAHWFNPILWYCFRRMRHDMEIATDQKVLELLEGSEHKEYGKALLLVLESFHTSSLTPRLICMVDDKKNTEKRIRMIKLASIFKSRRRLMMTTGLLCMLLLGCVLLTSGITGAKPTSDKKPTVDKRFEDLIKGKTLYVGNASKVSGLINLLEQSEHRGILALQTKKKPYGIVIEYKFDSAYWDKGYIEQTMRYNAIMLLALVDNADVVTFQIKGAPTKGKPAKGANTLNFSFTRQDLQKGFVRDIREYAADASALKLLSNSIRFQFQAAPQKYTMAMSSTPGIQISHDAINDTYTNYSTPFGRLLDWNHRTGKITQYGKSAKILNRQPIYWSESEETMSRSKTLFVDAIICNTSGKPLIEKRLEIIRTSDNLLAVRQRPDVTVSKNLLPDAPGSSSMEEAVHKAILSRASKRSDALFNAEGHVILDTEESKGILKVYAMASQNSYGFENDVFTGVGGSGAIPTLITFTKDADGFLTLKDYKEPMDGSYYTSSIKEMFPRKLWSKALDNQNYPELWSQQDKQAQEYLQSIGRTAKVSLKYVDRKLLEIDTQASNTLIGMRELSQYPYWIGTKEYVENGVTYIYKTSKEKSSDGLDLVKYEKFTAGSGSGSDSDRKLIESHNYKIIGHEPRLVTNDEMKIGFTIANLSSIKDMKPAVRLSPVEAAELLKTSTVKEITYDDFFKQMGIQVFKYKDQNGIVHSYMIKKKNMVSFGSLTNGLDTKDICLSDLDSNGKPELIYYVTMGSGLNITQFQCLSEGKMLDVSFSSIKFIAFTFIKKDMQNVELAVWYPDIPESAKQPIAIGKLFLKDNVLGIKLYEKLEDSLKDYVRFHK